MSLATRCPACGTIFRVVQDQLKVSEGWVRCGQCHEVFHGIEALFDLDSDPAIAARRGAGRAPAPPSTRVFADARASASVPLPRPPAPPAVFGSSSVFAPTAPGGFAPTAPGGFAPTAPVSLSPQFAPPPSPRSPIAIPARAPAPVDDSRAVSATPSAFGNATLPPADAPIAPMRPGFGPAPVVARGTIAPRFAARLAEESARAQAVAVAPAPAWQVPAEPTSQAVDLSDPPQAFAPVPAPGPSFEPAPFDEPAFAPEPVPEPWIAASPAPAPFVEPPPPAPTAAELAVAFAAPPPAPLLPPAPEPAPSAAFPVAVVSAPAPVAAPAVDDSDDDDDEDERAGPPTLASLLPEDAGEWPPRKQRRKREAATSATTELALVDPSKDPRFLREARSGARWRRPWVRAVLGVAFVALLAGALGQLAWPQRDTLASRWPAARPAWDWLCEQAGCRIEAPRALASLALDGSSLTRTDTEHVLLFSADLHNRSDHEVRMPSFDLSFMDLNGEIVARKVLTPAQIGIHLAALPADGELHVHARLQVAGLDATGFQADLFYP